MKSIKRIAVLFVALTIFSSVSIYARTFDEAYNIPIHFYSTDLNYNQDYLDGIWDGYGDDAVSKWDYWGSPLTDDEVSFSESKIDIVTADNYNFPTGVVGMANIFDSDGTNLNGNPISEFDSSGEVTYASIYMNSTTINSYTSTQKKAIIAHEVGHVLGLWHPASSSTKSIMSSSSGNSGWTTSLQSEDKDDIDEIY